MNPLDTIQRGPELGREEFHRLAAVVHGLAGISLTENKQPLVQARVGRRLRALGLASFASYAALVESEGAAAEAERQRLIAAITTNVTRFFREPYHFEMLTSRILPELVARVRRGGRLRLWSAGCSTGEEPYSIALTLLGAFPDVAHHDVRILATDIDTEVLATAIRGVYSAEAARSVPAALRRAYLPETSDGRVQVGPEARGLVRFRRLNLARPWPMTGRFDVIFCRNVVIYFDAETKDGVWRRFAQYLPVGGHLFVGHSERIDTLALPALVSDGTASYRRGEDRA